MWLFEQLQQTLSNSMTFNDGITFKIKPLCYLLICCSDLFPISVLSSAFPISSPLSTLLSNLLCTFSFVLFTDRLQ